jgi:hypothetical protein
VVQPEIWLGNKPLKTEVPRALIWDETIAAGESAPICADEKEDNLKPAGKFESCALEIPAT